MSLGKRLAELDKAATPSPWVQMFNTQICFKDGSAVILEVFRSLKSEKIDAELIAIMRNNLQQILKALAVQEAVHMETMHCQECRQQTIELGAEILAEWTGEQSK